MARKESKTKLFLPIFLGGLMILSVFGVVTYGFASGGASAGRQSVKYGDYTFVGTQNGFWTSRIGGHERTFAYNPEQVSSLEVTSFPLNDFNNGAKIYITYNPRQVIPLVLNELQYNVLPAFTVNPFRACSEDVEGCEDFPLKTCEDASFSDHVIFVELADEFSITYEDHCYIIRGQDIQMAQAVDKVAFEILGIL